MVALRRESTRPVTVQYSPYVTHGDRSFMPFLGHCLRANHINTRSVPTPVLPSPSGCRHLQSRACEPNRATTATANDTGKPVAYRLGTAVTRTRCGCADPGPGQVSN